VPVESRPEGAKILIAGVGYRNLRDMSLGPVLTDRLSQDAWPQGVEVEDLSYSPIGVMHNLDERGPYDRIIFVAGVRRDRQPGGVYSYRWEHQLPDPEEIQARVAEAVTGVISLDNLLIIATYFGKLPRDVMVIEVEAADASWGEGFAPYVETAIPKVIEEIRYYVTGCGIAQ
jgi:hydrogenase maturation protease